MTARSKWALALLLVAAAVLRAVRLDAPLWFDEIWMVVDFVRLPSFGELLSTYPSDNNHPLYTALARVCVEVFGESPWALRLPAAAFGVASVWALHRFARDRFDGLVAMTAAGVLALSFHHIAFSQNARAYTGLLFFTLLSSHFFLEALRTGKRRAWVGHGLCLALCTYLHVTGVFVAVGQVAVLIVAAWRGTEGDGGRRAALQGLALAIGTSLLLHALILGQMVRFFLFRPDRVAVDAEWTNPLWMLGEAAQSLGFGLGLGLVALAVGGGVLLVGLVRTWRREPAVPILFVVPSVVVAVAMLALGRNLWPRLFFFVAGFAVLVGVEGVLGVAAFVARRLRCEGERPWPVKLAAALLVVGAAATAPRALALPKQDYPAAMAYVEEHRAPGEPVLAVGLAAMPYRDYYDTDYAALAPVADVTDADAVAQYDAAFADGRAGYLLVTFPIFTASRHPDLWARIRATTREVARFRGSIGGGDLVVLRAGD